MEFGKAELAELETTDFSLPADHEQTKKVLGGVRAAEIKIHVGCSKWSRPDWVGKLYPKGTKPGNFLEVYAKQFNCIELNSIYHRLPSKDEIQTWKNKVGKDFKFCPKFTEAITHTKRLKDVKAHIEEFLDVIHELQENLGPVFLLPHPAMGPKTQERILSFLGSIPETTEIFTELRHPEWFVQPHFDSMFSALQEKNHGVVITDAAGRRDCVHMRLTAGKVFIRFIGNSLHKTDYERIDDWVQRIKQWMEQGLQECYFFMHQHEELYSPDLCKYLIEQLNTHCNTNIKVPVFVSQDTLF
jgi:uncharacterized protein YecE (DUF72 family)